MEAYLKATEAGGRGFRPPLAVESDSIEIVKDIRGEVDDLSETYLISKAVSEIVDGENVSSFSKCP